MKGPRSRTRHVAWRLWECPKCCKRAWSPSQTAQLKCACIESTTWMVPVEVKRNRDPGFPPLERPPQPSPPPITEQPPLDVGKGEDMPAEQIPVRTLEEPEKVADG